MKVVAAVLCVALGTTWHLPARAEEIQPSFEGLEPGGDPAETYRLNTFGIVREEVSSSFPALLFGRTRWWRPVRGKFRRATRYDDFYLSLGRDELGARDRRRGVVAASLSWGGTLITVGGVVVLVTELVKNRTTRFEVGGGMVVGGAVISSIGSSIQPPLVSEHDAIAMATEYNRRLHIHLGLDPAIGATGGRDRLPIGLALSHRW